MACLGIGHTSRYNFYILVAVISKLFSDYILGLNTSNLERPATLFNFIPILNDHYIFQNLLELLSYFFGGILMFFLSKKMDKNMASNELLVNEGLSFSTNEDFKKNYKKEIYIGILLISLLFSLNLIIRTYLYLNFLDLELWMLEIIFISLLSTKILKIKINRHKLAAMFLVIPLLIMEFISCSLPETHHSDNSNDEYMTDYSMFQKIGKKVGYYFIPILYLLFIILTIMRDYSWVKSKYLIDKKTFSFYKILLFIGIIGIFIAIISYIISGLMPCNIYNNVTRDDSGNYLINDELISFAKDLCYLKDYNEEKKTLTLYYDNFIILLKKYSAWTKNIKLEIFIAIPLYVIMLMIKNCSYIIMICYLEPYNILISDNFYYFLNRLIVYIINEADEEYLTVTQFILMELMEIIYIISNLIYIEILELKFCNLDYDLKKNIHERSITEIDKEIEVEDMERISKESKEEKVEVSEGYEVSQKDFKKEK